MTRKRLDLYKSATYSTGIAIFVKLSPILDYRPEDGLREYCPYNEDYKLDCIKISKSNNNIIRLSEDEVKRIKKLGKVGGVGAYGTVYFSKLDNKEVAIKIQAAIKDVSNDKDYTSFGTEICLQHKASEHGLAPKVLGYWKCDNDERYGVIVMERIRGDSLDIYILDDEMKGGHMREEIFYKMIREILELNFRANVLHGDLNYYNIIIDASGKVIFIDYGLSSLNERDDYLYYLENYSEEEDALAVREPARVFHDLNAFMARYVKFYSLYGHGIQPEGFKTFTLNIKKRLTSRDRSDYNLIWKIIFRYFYDNNKRLPSADEGVEVLHDLLSGKLKAKLDYPYGMEVID